MNKEFYRFRRIGNLLGDFKELERQSIYFAEPSSLNDPMEGFRDIYWKGDIIVWRNLFRHYLLCLERLCSLYIISGEEFPVSEEHMPVFSGEDDFPTPMYRKLFLDISNIFLSNEYIAGLINAIASRTTPIRRDELFFYLNSVHAFALEVIFSKYEEMGFIAKRERNNLNAIRQVRDLLKKDFIGLIEITLKEANGEEKATVLFTANRHINQQMDIIFRRNNISGEIYKNKSLIMIEFTEKYISQIEKLVFPNWYTACFMSECKSSSVWGHYGDNHAGVCLIYNSNIIDGKPNIKLKGRTGYSSSGPSYGYVNRELYPIDYTQDYGHIDFFRMLGRLPIPKLNSMWYSHNGEMSVCADEMISSEDKWREKYWNDFYRDIRVKSKDWSYENEYRIIISSSLDSFEDPKDRVLNYEFLSLKGIIFGIKTKIEDKLRIIKIIEEKCKANNRDDFEFHQAYYAHSEKCIKHSKLDLLRFKKDTSSTV